MKNLYIDFDGVILDTITPVYNLAKKLNLDVKKQSKEIGLLYSKIDWESLIEESEELSNSINSIKDLKASGKFNISILTHINSLKEAKAKIEFINSLFDDLTIIYHNKYLYLKDDDLLYKIQDYVHQLKCPYNF